MFYFAIFEASINASCKRNLLVLYSQVFKSYQSRKCPVKKLECHTVIGSICSSFIPQYKWKTFTNIKYTPWR